MSTWLLLATAFAQDCTPDVNLLVAAPGPDATDVPPDISPALMFPGDRCREDLRMELVDTDQGIPNYTGSVTGNQLSPWNLATSKEYEVQLFAGQATEPFTSWTFTTSEDRWAEPLRGPSYLTMTAWIEELEDGSLEQIVQLNVETVDQTERIVYVETDGLVLWAGNPSQSDLSLQNPEIRYPVGSKSTPYCVTLVDLDEVGNASEESYCVDQSPPVTRLDSRCATGPRWIDWPASLLRR